jgi:hypothetical protein
VDNGELQVDKVEDLGPEWSFDTSITTPSGIRVSATIYIPEETVIESVMPLVWAVQKATELTVNELVERLGINALAGHVEE